MTLAVMKGGMIYNVKEWEISVKNFKIHYTRVFATDQWKSASKVD